MSGGYTYILRFIALLAVVFVLNVIVANLSVQWDLTEDKRFTLSERTKDVLDELNQPILISILLSDDIPANLRRLRNDCEDLIKRMNRVNFQLEFEYRNPLEGTLEESNEAKQQLAEAGIYPVNINVGSEDGFESRLIYPYAILTNGDQQYAISLLEEAVVDFDPQEQLNQSIALLEFKFINALKRFVNPEKKLVGFTTGNGEAAPQFTADLERNLAPFYNTLRLNPDSVLAIPPEVAVLIVADPSTGFSDRAKFQIDQYVMRGGNVIFALDRMDANLDSIGKYGQYVPQENDYNLDDLLFRYGLRLNYNLVQDLECTRIPMGTGKVGGQNQLQRFKWYYHLMALPGEAHPVTRGLDRINLFFPSTIDTLQTGTDIRRTVIVSSSPRSRVQNMPAQLDFNILRYPPIDDKFSGGPYMLGVLQEGPFLSNYANRPPADILTRYKALDIPFLQEGGPAMIALLADGEAVTNKIQPSTGKPLPLGYNPYENTQFANKQLILNLVEYMTDGFGVMGLRSRELVKRPLNTSKIRSEKHKWLMITIGLPLVFFLFFGIIYNLIRRRKYA